MISPHCNYQYTHITFAVNTPLGFLYFVWLLCYCASLIQLSTHSQHALLTLTIISPGVTVHCQVAPVPRCCVVVFFSCGENTKLFIFPDQRLEENHFIGSHVALCFSTGQGCSVL